MSERRTGAVRGIRSRCNGGRESRDDLSAGWRTIATVCYARDRFCRLIPHCVGRDAIIASYVCIVGPHEARHVTRVFAAFVMETVRRDGKIDTPNNTPASLVLFSEPIDRRDCSIVVSYAIISDTLVRRTLIPGQYRHVDIT